MIRTFLQNRDNVSSAAGWWDPQGHVFLHGYNVHENLTLNNSWFQTLLLAISGRMVPPEHVRIVEALYVVTSYPDPRLWCNRIGALAGSSRCTTASSLAASIASTEAKLFGGQAEHRARKFLIQAEKKYRKEGMIGLQSVANNCLQQRRMVFGFGRPMAKIEERIEPVMKLAKSMNIETGTYLDTAFTIEEILKKKKLVLNFAGFSAAWLLDLGFKPKEISCIVALSLYLGILPCYIEAFEKEPGTFLPIACEDILYEGLPERPVPK